MSIETRTPGEATVSKKLQEVFGCKPFAGKIMTWSEVASRLIYVAFLNQRSGWGFRESWRHRFGHQGKKTGSTTGIFDRFLTFWINFDSKHIFYFSCVSIEM